MRYVLGISATFLLIAAIWLIFAGLNMQIGYSAPAGMALPEGLNGIANLASMHVQLLDVILGGVSALSSFVLYAAAAIVAAIQDRPSPDA